MNRDKQIREMAEIINKNTEFDTMWDEIYASANALYDAGYRKSTEVVKELFEEAIKLAKEIADNSAVLAKLEENPIKRIESKGEQIGALLVLEILVELKKKYTEEPNVNNNH